MSEQENFEKEKEQLRELNDKSDSKIEKSNIEKIKFTAKTLKAEKAEEINFPKTISNTTVKKRKEINRKYVNNKNNLSIENIQVKKEANSNIYQKKKPAHSFQISNKKSQKINLRYKTEKIQALLSDKNQQENFSQSINEDIIGLHEDKNDLFQEKDEKEEEDQKVVSNSENKKEDELINKEEDRKNINKVKDEKEKTKENTDITQERTKKEQFLISNKISKQFESNIIKKSKTFIQNSEEEEKKEENKIKNNNKEGKDKVENDTKEINKRNEIIFEKINESKEQRNSIFICSFSDETFRELFEKKFEKEIEEKVKKGVEEELKKHNIIKGEEPSSSNMDSISQVNKEKEKEEANEIEKEILMNSNVDQEKNEIINDSLKNKNEIEDNVYKKKEKEETIYNYQKFKNKEIKEENVNKHEKKIKQKSSNDLKSKNKNGKFLMEEKLEKKETKSSINDIINNFEETESIIKKYIKEFDSIEEKIIFFKNQGFILTEKSKERLALIIHYILNGINALLEGNTGTSKTRTVLVACNYIKLFIQKKDEKERKLIRYNLSAETKIDDLIAKYANDKQSLVGLKVKNGPFIEAYVNGYIMLLDEINLAQINVLQCFQQSLDNGEISVETNGNCLLKYKKNPNFAIMATQNPNKGAYIGKRQELGPEFLSRFQKIYFPEIQKEEMREIAKGIAENLGYLGKERDKNYKYKIGLLTDIVDLHYEWAKKNESETDVQCFTIREIESVIECLSNGEDAFNTIMTIYGGRYKRSKKNDLKQKLKNYKILKSIKIKKVESLPKNFPKCFVNNALIQTVSSVLLALKNKRNVIIIGNNESGLTQVAEWCSKYFNKEIKSENKHDNSFICFCTKNLECSDLIGKEKISDKNNEILKFEPRFLFQAIKDGNCIVLDSIDEAPSRVIERLNGLLDKKNNKEESIFEVPENSNEPEIPINPDFRIICTSNDKKLNQISPAFINRFEVIYLEDQLEQLEKNEKETLIKFLCNKYQTEYNISKIESIKRNEIINEFNEFNKNSKEFDIYGDFEINKEMINMIKAKYDILSKGRNLNESFDDSNYNNNESFDENSKKYLTMSSFNKFIRTFIILKNEFKEQINISIKSIINFSFELLFEKNISDENKENETIINYLKEILKNNNKKNNSIILDEEYYFEGSESLEKFMVQIFACSLVNQYLCIIGPPGIGKTLGARKFALIRENIKGIQYDAPFYMHSFHRSSRPRDYFGTYSLKDKNLIFKEGTLTKAIKQGNVFIGDEFNISNEDCMKAITPILELKFNENIIIPGIDKEFLINPDFFLIICQNTKETSGRQELPEKIKTKIKVIEYPERIKEEIKIICENMWNNKFSGRKKCILTKNDAGKFANFMEKLNNNEILTPWSLRDISKLFARIYKQSLNPDNYQNLGIKEHILFYILSSNAPSLINKERINNIIYLISQVFRLQIGEENYLNNLYFEPSFCEIKNNKIIVKKGKIEIVYGNYKEEIYNKLNGLTSVLDALFKILLSTDDEPILISGPSSYKTFLAKLIFKERESEVISLNSEINMTQLIGSTIILTKDKAKNYYLKQIYEILQAKDIDNSLLDFEKNKDKINKKIEELTKEFDKNQVKKMNEKHPFYYAFSYFKKKLNQNEKNEKSLFNMVLEFKPGIFLSARIKGHNLILKNITKMKTENLERLNEVFTGNKKITLNEDFQNSFTKENNKEISFNDDFRVVATCKEGEETSLSEAFLSRFTLIYVNEYIKEEELKVLKQYEDSNNIRAINKMLNKKNLSQKINCINIAKELDKNRKNTNSHEDNLKLSAYYLSKGLTENREEKINDINKDFEISNYYNKINDSPFIENKEEHFIISKFNGLKMNIKQNSSSLQKKEKPSIYFSLKIKEILDAIHFSISTGTPLILEGDYGQGKKLAIEYYSNITGLELELIQISKSTKVDDLLGKTIIKQKEEVLEFSKTVLCQAIECNENYPNKLILIEGINNANADVLDILNSIYGEKGTNILLPNGSKIKKGNMNLISIFNPSDNFTREKLVGNLMNNSLYFIVEDPNENDITNIIRYLFEETKLEKEEGEDFLNKFLEAQKIAKEENGESPITLHEVRKYISFRKSIPELDKKLFMTFIFDYHFNQIENKIKVRNNLKLNEYNFEPIINYDGDKKHLTFQTSKTGKSNNLRIRIKYPEKINVEELKNKFKALTFDQKFCFLFLLCCVKAKKTPIIQGVTASGKSFIIKIFAEILGMEQELSIYQLNSNSGLSLFTGQHVIKKEFENDEKEKLSNILELLNQKNKNIKDICLSDFSLYQEIIKKKLNTEELTENEKKSYNNALITLTELKSPFKRFEHQDSELIEGIRKGKWVVLEGIEMTNIQISEKISSLCGEAPKLQIYESGLKELNFGCSSYSENIHSDFRLFIINNPLSQNAKKIDQTLINNCIKFSLPSIESNPTGVTTFLYEKIKNGKNLIEYDEALWNNLCRLIAKYHIEKTLFSRENTDLMVGNVPFTARNLCFVSNDFIHSFKKGEETSWFKSIFENYYWISFKKEKKILEKETLDSFKVAPDQRYKVEKQDLPLIEEFKEITEYLEKIQKYAKNNNEYNEFDFPDFLYYCLKVPINEEKINYIKIQMEDTLNLLNGEFNMDEILKNNFYQIYFIKNNYDYILNHFDKVSGFQDKMELNNDDLLKNEDIRDNLLRMRFLYLLLESKNIKIYNPNLNYELFTPNFIDLTKKLLNKLSDLIKEKTRSSFISFILFLTNENESFKLVHYYYPYDDPELKQGELKYSNYYIYLFHSLYIKKINFSIRIEDEIYDIQFQENQDKKYNPYFILNESDSLLLSEGSYLEQNITNPYDNKLKKKNILVIEESSEKKTRRMFEYIRDLNKLPIKSLEEIDEFQIETRNFFLGEESSLISRILSLIINLTDNLNYPFEYLEKNCCFLEKDLFKRFTLLYQNLYKWKNLKDFVNVISNLSFFCESSSESMLWKYRALLNKKIDDNECYKFFQKKGIDPDKEIELIKAEKNNLEKLNKMDELDEEHELNGLGNYLGKDNLENYLNKLKNLIELIISYKFKDSKEREKGKLINKANDLLDLLEKKVNNKFNSIKYLDLLKKEISQYIDSENPTEEILNNLQNKVKTFIDLVEKKQNLDTLDLPNKEIIKYYYNKNNERYEKISKKYELLFWFNSVEEKLDILFDNNTEEQEYMKLIMSLINDSDLEPILTFINDKKLENPLTDYDDLKTTKQMLRGILISKMKKENIDLDDFNNIVKDINSNINHPGEISEEEYYLSYIISDNYSKNLKITMPIFEALDIFYFFFKYANENKGNKGKLYKLSDFLKDAYNKSPFKLDNIYKILDNFEKTKSKDIIEFSEYICMEFFYKNICNKELKVDSGESVVDAMKRRAKKMEEKEKNKKNFLNTIIYYLEFIEEFGEKIAKKQTPRNQCLRHFDRFQNKNQDNYKFVLNDLEKLLDINKKNQTACSYIFKNKENFSSTFIYYVNNNRGFINELFREMNLPKEIKDIEYLPFWLFILRNISLLNCIEYDNKYVDQNIANNIVNKIKEELLKNQIKNYDWVNLLTDNIALELYNKKINSFYIFFNSLFEYLNLSEKNVNINKLIKSELEKYYNEIIYYAFYAGNKFNSNFSENDILNFTKDPAIYLFNKVSGYISQKFFDNINNINTEFYTRLKKLDENFNLKIIQAKEELKKIELGKLLLNREEKINKKKSKFLHSYSDYTSAIKNIQISDTKLDEFRKFQNKLIKKQIYLNFQEIII